jgi:hypothetical protein
MYYLLSLITFIFYYISINIFKIINIKLNKYKQIYQYKIVYEDNIDPDYNFLDPLYLGILLLPVYIQNVVMISIILYIIKDLLEYYLKEKESKNVIIIKTYKTFFGIMISINTIYNYNYNDYNNYIFTSIMNVISLCLLFNNYQVMICNSFTNS